MAKDKKEASEDQPVPGDAVPEAATESVPSSDTPAAEAAATRAPISPAPATEGRASEETAAAEAGPTGSEQAEAQPTAPAEAAGPAVEEPPAPPAEGEAPPELTLGAGLAGEEAAEPVPAPTIRGKLDPRTGCAIGTGRRKTSVARVRVKEGIGELNINGRGLEEYFKTERDRLDVLGPLKAADMQGQVDVWVRVSGGGTTGQAGAIVLGIARALQAMNPELHHALSDGGYLTRDSRMVERKKYGYKKARRSFQFSKR